MAVTVRSGRRVVTVMTTPVTVSENDLHTMLRIVNAPEMGDDGEGLPWSTMYGLDTLIPGTGVVFIGLNARRKLEYLGQETSCDGADIPDADAIFWEHYWDSMCSYAERTGDLQTVNMITDFCTLHEFRQMAIYTELFRLRGDENSMHLNLPDGPDRILRLIFWRGRGDPNFTERDRALLILLRPHLYIAHQQVLRRRRGIPDLTNRQWQLLRLVDAGLSNTQIAHRLHLAESTVRKHLENIFERLQVSSRTAAIAKALPERFLI